MSVIRDLLNGIMPQNRRMLDLEELEKLQKADQQRQLEREQKYFKEQNEKTQKMKSADATMQMANWIVETLLSISPATQSHYWKNGIVIRIESWIVTIYEGYTWSDGGGYHQAKTFSSLGYEPIPDGYLSPFYYALMDLVRDKLGYGYSITYHNSNSTGVYEYLVTTHIVPQREQLKSW